MENKITVGYPAMIFIVLMVLVLHIVAIYSEIPLLLNASKVILIPILLLLFVIKHESLNIIFTAFLMFSFFGNSASWFVSGDHVANGSNIMYLLSYLALMVIVAPRFKPSKMDRIVGIYLLGVLFINGYFLYTICSILNNLISDGMEMLLFGAKSMSLILLVFLSFGVYLCTQTKASILFLIMAICFAFSDILNYVATYYIYHWSILMLDRLLHIAGLLFAFKFIMENNVASKDVYIETRNRERIYSKDNILA